MFEGTVLDGKGVEAVTKLPTKKELMQNTAIMLKKLPGKLAISLNDAGAERLARSMKQAQGEKLVKALDLMKDKL